jgi:hypothetical protein
MILIPNYDTVLPPFDGTYDSPVDTHTQIVFVNLQNSCHSAVNANKKYILAPSLVKETQNCTNYAQFLKQSICTLLPIQSVPNTS